MAITLLEIMDYSAVKQNSDIPASAWHSPIFIALGSNLGDRANNLRLACSTLETCASISITKRSCLYSSLSMYDIEQPDFLNMVCECVTLLEPLDLLAVLQSIEIRLGRLPRAKNITRRFAARPIDLDIIYYEELVFSDNILEIPHPRLYERPFVLNPLCELAPDFQDPLRECSVSSLRLALQERGSKDEALRL